MANGWSREELFIAVDYYIRMLNEERLGNQYSKIEYLRSAHELIPERTIKSIEMRMQNISAVLDANGELWIEGFKPLRNVGKNIANQILEILNETGFVATREFAELAASLSNPMKVSIRNVMRLQNSYSREATSEMVERGKIIRDQLPVLIRNFSSVIAETLQIPEEDLIIEGRDGTGGKTEIPWVRFASKKFSPRATLGRYCVFLFDSTGDAVYLTLNFGTSEWVNKDVVPLPDDQLKEYANWARGVCEELVSVRDDLIYDIDLQCTSRTRARSYEPATAVALKYEKIRLPNDETLVSDILFFAKLLQEVYSKVEIGADPLEVPQEVLEVIEISDGKIKKSGVSKSSSQGFRLNPAQRKAIELRGMEVARQFLELEGWGEIVDVSGNHPYDLSCRRNSEELTVEVKGTTSDGRKQIILTRGEVQHNKENSNHALAFVSGIELGGDNRDIASGGNIEFIHPWKIDDDDLEVVSYTYKWK